MKILIGYDGSKSAEATLDDLQLAGLPSDCEALVLSVNETWLPSPSFNGNGSGVKLEADTNELLQKQLRKIKRTVGEAEIFARHAQTRLRATFPAWKIDTAATSGSPGAEILDKADTFNADLIVVGSRGRFSSGSFVLGSISSKVVSQAKCSVRVARGKIGVARLPARIIIGFDGSAGAKLAVETTAGRKWRENTEIRLIAATSQIEPATLERFVPLTPHKLDVEGKAESGWLEKLAESSLRILRDANITATLHITAGNPKQVLIEEAEKWHASSIFIGANSSGGRMEQFLLGSTSEAMTTRASCSVEVVRLKTGQ